MSFLAAGAITATIMTNADKIIGFLNVAGDWDPTLAFVMVGAIVVHLLFFRLIMRRESPLFATHFGIPTRKDIDKRLVIGSALFGVGWGLGGFLPWSRYCLQRGLRTRGASFSHDDGGWHVDLS